MNQPNEIPADTNIYLLQLSGAASGTTETFSVHMLVNQKMEQLFVPLQDIDLPELPSTIKSSEKQHKQLKEKSSCVNKSVIQTKSIKSNKEDHTFNFGDDTEAQPDSKSKDTDLQEELSTIKSSEKQSYVNKPLILTKSSIESSIKEKCTFDFDDGTETQPDSGKSKGKYQRIQNYVHIHDSVAPPRAIAVLPDALQIRRSDILPRRMLPARTRFGPLQGIMKLISAAESGNMVSQAAADKTPIFLLGRTEESVLLVDVFNKDICNWMGLLPLGDQNTANVWLYEEGGNIYGVTTNSIASRTPLALGYSSAYAESHRIPPGQPVLDIHEALQARSKQWWCYECQRVMGSPALLQYHMDTHHKVTKPLTRRRYRCTQCSRTFCRLFTLKRHMLVFCAKPEETDNDNQTNTSHEQVEQEVFNTLPNVEDSNRVPSDESLQNYTNPLDFSINLFDTDRIPNLDISGGSRSENDFNPYSIGYRDENFLENDSRLCNSSVSSKQTNKSKKTDDRIFVSCPYCDQTLVKEKRRHHWRECRKRRIACECGQIFKNKQRLASHIHMEHSFESKKKYAVSDSSVTPYKCEECSFSSKRRGILVNHYWRVHKRSTSVPLERRVRYYPCVACPKIYCTADKRNRHVRAHHPDMKLIRAEAIEGERRTLEPALCTACPRQYATRAKLLQHMRDQHPNLAAPKMPKGSQKPARQKKT